MKAKLSLIVLAALVALGLAAQATSTNTAAKPAKKGVVRGAYGLAGINHSGDGLLIDAYHHLESADHDYKGHRIRAMRQIEAAARLMGVNLHGDGHDHEKQGVSDEHLRNAESLLESAAGHLAGKPLHHVREALNQLTVALKVK